MQVVCFLQITISDDQDIILAAHVTSRKQKQFAVDNKVLAAFKLL